MAYGNKRDYRAIRIYVSGKYVGTTTWSKSLKEAKDRYHELTRTSVKAIHTEYKE